MKAYLLGLFALCFVCAFVELLAPQGEGGGIARHIRLLTGLCLLCTLLQPVLSLVQGIQTIPERFEEWLDSAILDADRDDKDWETEIKELDHRLATAQIEKMLCEEFDIRTQNCRVSIRVDDEQSILTEIRVELSGNAIWQDTHAIENFLKGLFDCPCIIYVSLY